MHLIKSTQGFFLSFIVSLGIWYFIAKRYFLTGMNVLLEGYFSRSLIFTFGFSFVLFYLLYFFRKRWRDYLGFIFLAGSLIKFGAYFLWLRPMRLKILEFEQEEFLLFFIPYTLSMVIEVYFLSRLLNSGV